MPVAKKVGLRELFVAVKARWTAAGMPAVFTGGIHMEPVKTGDVAPVRPYAFLDPRPGEARLPGDSATDWRDFGFSVTAAADDWDTASTGSGDLVAQLKAALDNAPLTFAGNQNNAQVQLLEAGDVQHEPEGTYWTSKVQFTARVVQDAVPS